MISAIAINQIKFFTNFITPMYIKYILILFFSPLFLCGQDLILFTDASSVLSNASLKGGPFCGFIDINGDYRDDLIRFDGASELYIDIQSNNGQNFISKNIANIPGGSWSILAADINNDGVNEIFTAGSYNGATILNATNTQSDFSISQLTETDFFAQNSNFVDMNNDGWLDIFICDDDGLSEIYLNEGNGLVAKNNSFIDMSTVPLSDNSGNYSSVWTDIDDDGDLDLYIAKCRLGIQSPTDPRRVNTLFINEDGEFREAAGEFGIAVGEQSWTSNFGDIDNDGDQDLFMINHDSRSMLFENINNESFQEIPILDSGDDLITIGYQSAFADFNNDGFLDILIAGEKDFLLINDGSKSFQLNETPFGKTDIVSFAVGDSNQDGFLDILAEYNNFFSSKEEETKLFRALKNENHHIAVSLNGIESNKNGIGAKLTIYGNWGKQTRYIKSGTGYGITNSLTARFGLNDETTIDSLIIQWPSGLKDIYPNIGHDKFYLATEGICLEELTNATSDNILLDCQNEEVTINLANPNNLNIEWSNGLSNETTNTITEFDHINATLTRADGCVNKTQSIVIDTLKALNIPTLNIIDNIKICENALPIEIANNSGDDLIWQDGSFDNEFKIESSGQYFVQISNKCDTVFSSAIEVEVIDPKKVANDSTIIINQGTELTIDNFRPNNTWYSDPQGENIIGTGNVLSPSLLDKDTAFYYNFEIEQKPPIYVGGKTFKPNQLPNFPIFEELGAFLTFQTLEAVNILNTKVHTDIAGKRIIEIASVTNAQIVYQDTFDLNIGMNSLELNASLEKGTYEIRTNIDFNFSNYSTNSPLLSIIFEDVSYPYVIGDLIDIQSSSLGDNLYPYFFDWLVSPIIDSCTSDIFKITVDIDSTNSVNTLEDTEFDIFPNPYFDQINIQSNVKINQINVFTSSGQLVYERNLKESTSNITIKPDLESGVYFLQLISEKGTYQKTLIAY